MAIGIIIRDKSKYRGPSFGDNKNTGEILKIGREINRAVSRGYDHRKITQEFGNDANKICAVKPEKDTLARELAVEAVRQIKES